MSPPRSLLVLVVGGALLAGAAADAERRCTEISEGELVGEPLAPDPTLAPPGERRANITIPLLEACGAAGARGLVVTACDVLPPQLELAAAGGAEWGAARVLRLGPLWLPLLVEFTLFCDPSPAPAPPTTAAVDPAPEPPAPVVVPEQEPPAISDGGRSIDLADG